MSTCSCARVTLPALGPGTEESAIEGAVGRLRAHLVPPSETLSHSLCICTGNTGANGNNKVRNGAMGEKKKRNGAMVLTSRKPVAMFTEVAIVPWAGLERKEPKWST